MRPSLHFVIWLTAAGLLASAEWPQARAQSMEEYNVKALVLYNFAKFVDWPAAAFRSPTDPISICVLGADPFGAALDAAILGHTVTDRPLVVRRISDTRKAGTCQVLFISSSERKKLRSILDSIRASEILTVGETEDFTALGGVVRFILEDGRIHFEINQQAAADQRLRISSNVLRLARLMKK